MFKGSDPMQNKIIVKKQMVAWLFSALLLFVTSAVHAEDWRYSFKEGDTLWSICKTHAYYNDCWKELGVYNNIDVDTAIPIGTKIRIPLPWLNKKIVAGKVVFFSGQAMASDKAGQEKTLKQNMEIDIGDKLRVKQGQMTIEFADGSTLTMLPDSSITVDAVSAVKQTRQTTVEISLPTGGAVVKVPKKEPRNRFRVITPSGVAAVRGTEFRVRNAVIASDQQANENNQAPSEQSVVETRSEILEGVVAYTSDSKEVAINEGFGLLAKQGESLPEPVQLLPAPEWVANCEVPEIVEWYTLKGADYYVLEAFKKTDKGTKRILSEKVQKTYYRFNEIEDGCYELTLKGVENQFYGLESSREFCYTTVVPKPEIKFATQDKESLSMAVVDTPEHTQYVVEFANNEAFDKVLSVKTVEQAELSLLLSEINGDKQARYVRVKAINAKGVASDYSDIEAIVKTHSDWWALGFLVLAALVAL